MKRTPDQQKGQIHYMSYQTKMEIVKTVTFFALSIAVFLIGLIGTGSKKNLWTIIAILGLLPSSKSLVNMIMFLRVPKFSDVIYKTMHNACEQIDAVYGLVLTAYEGTYPCDCIAVRGQNLIIFTAQNKMKTQKCEEHIQGMLKKDNLHNMTVKVFTDQGKFCNRIEQLKSLDDNGKEQQVLELMCNISL